MSSSNLWKLQAITRSFTTLYSTRSKKLLRTYTIKRIRQGIWRKERTRKKFRPRYFWLLQLFGYRLILWLWMSSPSLWGLQTQHAFKVLSALSSSEQVSLAIDTIQYFLCELGMKCSENHLLFNILCYRWTKIWQIFT